MYLLDTNIWLERLLDQQQSKVIEQLLNQLPSNRILISDFTLHSIALALTRRRQFEAFARFIQDIFVDGSITLIRLSPEDLPTAVATMQQQNLDYDDAYQYAIAERYNLTLVSFDADFDHTERGRQTPTQVLESAINS